MTRIGWLYTDWSVNAYRQENNLYGGIAYYRVIKPAQYLKKWFDIDVIGAEFRKWGVQGMPHTAFQRLGTQYDLILLKHLTHAQYASNILATADYYKKKVVVDVDDNYFNIRKDNPAFKDYGKGKEGKYVLGALLELASGLTVSTEPLKEAYLPLNPNIDVLPNCNDIKDWPKSFKHNDKIIRIGYAGGDAHNEDLDLVCEAVARVLHKYPYVVFEVMGAMTVEKAREMAAKMLKFGHHKILDRFKIRGGTLAWQGYPEILASLGWDIGLAPLVDDPFNRGKSHIKWMEYAMVGAATVASPVYPYQEDVQGLKTIEHGKTGLFARTPDEWFEHIETLVRHAGIRKQMAEDAYLYIKNNWQWEQHAHKWKECISKYL